ncbi:MAG: sporulation integral membrane protein YtvI [Clostridia bacterium]|nr:sporulation integral membrane protein YtvI [Clostridia bacterium]
MIYEKRKRTLINIFYFAAILALAFLGIKYILPLFIPIIIGFIVAIVLQKPVAWLAQKTKISRGIWSTISVILLLAAAVVLLGALGFYLYNQLMSFADVIQSYIPTLTKTVHDLGDKFLLFQDRLPDAVATALEQLPSKAASTIATVTVDVLTSFAVGFASGLPGFILAFIFSILAGIFITSDYNKITGFILRQFSDEKREMIIKTKKLFVENILKMARGYLLIMVIMFFEMVIALSILRVDYQVVIALFIAVVDLLPVLGAGSILIPWGVVSVVLGNYYLGFGLLITYAAVVVIRNIIEPRIIGKQVGLAPLVTLTSMYVGMQLFGLAGLFMLPVIVIILVKLREAGMIKLWK